MGERQPKAFVTGWPIDQSLSPLIHRYWLSEHGIDGDYVKHACPPEKIKDFLSLIADHHFVGGNVTLPHKETAFGVVDHKTKTAEALGAVNTVWLDDNNLWGDNTDGYGFLANLDENSPDWDDQDRLKRGALVLGAGGAARAIIHSLQSRGFSTIWIANRTVERAEKLAQEFGEPCRGISMDNLTADVHKAGFVVNTTSLGMGDGLSPTDLSSFQVDTVVNDIVYKPLVTPLLAQAKTLGMMPVDGLGMLMHQAVPGFQRWFGVRPEVTATLKALLLDHIEMNR